MWPLRSSMHGRLLAGRTRSDLFEARAVGFLLADLSARTRFDLEPQSTRPSSLVFLSGLELEDRLWTG